MTKRLLVKKQGKIISALTREIGVGDIITVGNDPSAVIELNEEGILPEQFVIINENGQPLLLCRTDGILVNDRFLQQGSLHELQHEDKILVGNYSLQYEAEGSANRSENGAENPADITEDLHPPENLDEPENLPYIEAGNIEVHKTNALNREQTLTDILENLRAEEKYYFQIERISGESRRVYVENEQMRIGWSAEGECVIGTETAVDVPKAQIRKDWTGVILYPEAGQTVWLNNEIVSEPTRLKNDDRVFLSGQKPSDPERSTLIKFHEPTALLVLDSILPKELPPPVSLAAAGSTQAAIHQTAGGNLAATEETTALQAAPSMPKAKSAARIIGFFTLTEILIMIVGTLVTAAVIFLVLELSY
jgi:hypothetical protein